MILYLYNIRYEKIYNKNKLAFTLVEMLVVIAVIGILTTLAVVAVQNSRESTRNAKRVADIKQIQNALELYYNDNNAYPNTLIPGEVLSSNSITYIQQIPSAPTPNDGDCSEQENGFTYVTSKLQFDYFNVVANGTNHNTYYQCSNSNNYYNIYFCLSANTGSFLAGKVIASSQGLNSWTCGDSFLDYRDEQFYKTVQIGNKCWMAENLNYDDGCASASFSGDPGQANWCGCYDNNSSSCDIFGKLYQWRAAMKESESEEAQGICPDGWHIPDEDEIDEMIDYVLLIILIMDV